MGAVEAVWYAHTTKTVPTATTQAATRSAGSPIGTMGILDRLSCWSGPETGLGARRIGMPTYEVALMGLSGSAGIPPTSASGGASSWVSVSTCSEPTLFRRGGWYVTVTKFPPASISVKLTTHDSGIRSRGSARVRSAPEG